MSQGMGNRESEMGGAPHGSSIHHALKGRHCCSGVGIVVKRGGACRFPISHSPFPEFHA